jgi:hypothetical protein
MSSLILKRHWLLVQADLKIIFYSIWFYVIMCLAASIVWSFTLIQPRDDLTIVYLIDELDTAPAREVARRLSRSCARPTRNARTWPRSSTRRTAS